MVTEAIPARVFALYKIVTSKKGITRSEAKAMMEPEEIQGNTSYFAAILKAAVELKLLYEEESVLIPLPKIELQNINEFRRFAISKLNMFEKEQFYMVTNLIVNMDEQIFEYPLSDRELLNLISEQLGTQITPTMIRGWRFWASFLGFGYENQMSFLPNAYVFVKNVLSMINLERNMEYEMDDFMLRFDQYGKIIDSNLKTERNLNLALSSALRQLHDNKEIELIYRSDAEKRWVLYPSEEHFNDQIASIIYRGVKE